MDADRRKREILDALSLTKELQQAVWEADLIGLRSSGVPADEYDHEAQMIAELLDKNRKLAISVGHDQTDADLRGSTGIADAPAAFALLAAENIVYGVFVLQFGRDMAEKIEREKIAKLAETISNIVRR